uniref:Uncharacterized protein n=1 Tax=Cucumis sativus TaxID=3659 RepID=A0A0A0K571_CUCSA
MVACEQNMWLWRLHRPTKLKRSVALCFIGGGSVRDAQLYDGKRRSDVGEASTARRSDALPQWATLGLG